jgi:hypothetical protein
MAVEIWKRLPEARGVTTMAIQENERKFAELILYISQKSAFDSTFGSTKLNKILYFSDFLAYGKWGEAITGAEYQNLKRGPAPRRLIPVRKELEIEKALAIQPVQLSNGFVQHRVINLREANLTLFKASEIALVDEVIDTLKGLNATEASALSHLDVGWKVTEEGETIDYRTVFLSDEPLTESELRYLDFAEDAVAA